MKNLVISIVIIGALVTGLVLGFGFTSEASECENDSNMPQYLSACCVAELEERVFDMFLEDYCTNYCEECDCYYYEICDCEYACAECSESVECDFKVFICDNYDMIMELADEMLEEIQQEAKRDSMTYYELCEF
jgi:hypothetical protein